ncbi:RHS repeat domain-containing protein [Elizabethkingia meningoseptica]|uniref:RHS repeat domain-containing protein n=1 Tax=Elizabethkingia meningoseptica TaxID=238 RepID=UPI0023B02CC1|nr:RHS repeat domain-containing protein [Elizabethkingia meningoseptica]MDE5493453.1 RHS repeat protein [Elizabethkingia meningoseptica]
MKKILIATTIIAFQLIFSQNNPNYKPNITSPPPSVMEMEKYTNYNVDIKNGVSSFSIPIFNIKVGGLDIPLALEYHSSAVKYDFSTGELGINWKLSDFGYVSRTLRGRVDEHFDKPTENQLALLNNPSIQREHFLGSLLSDSDYSNYYDSMYDTFKYSTIDSNGEFIINNRANRNILSTNKYDKISYGYTPADWYIYDLKILNNKGIIYYYGKNPDNTGEVYISKPPTGVEPVTWYTTKIEGINKEFIRFSYDKRAESSYMTATTGNITESYISDIITDISGGELNWQAIRSPFSGFISDTEYPIPLQTPVIKEIKTSDNQKIIFTRDTSSPNLLRKIEIFDSGNKLIKKVLLNYSTIGQNPVLLGEVIISGGINDQNPQIYKFKYNDEGKYVTAHDQWGYFHEGGITGSQFPQFTSGTLSYNTFSSYANESWNLIPLGQLPFSMSSIPNLSRASDYYLMKEIQFPTGGKRLFEYEPHKFIASGNIKSFGARIKRIISFDNDNTPTLIKYYAYGENENGLGNIFEDLTNENYFFSESPIFHIIPSSPAGPVASVARNLTVHSVNPFHHYTDQLGNIFYPNVTEYNQTFTSDYNNESKTEHIYEVSSNYNTINFFNINSGYSNPGGGVDNYAYINKMLSNPFYKGIYLGFSINEQYTKFYKKEASSYSLIKQIYNQYKNGVIAEKNELLVNPYYRTSDGKIPYIYDSLYQFIKETTHFNAIADYNYSSFLISHSSLLDKQEITEYYPQNNTSATMIKQYGYNNFDLLTSDEIIDTDKGNLKTTYKYAYEKGNQKLINANMIGIPLHTTTTKDGKVVANVETKYDNPANLLPTSVLSYDLQNPGISQTEVVYDLYDNKANILQYSEKAIKPTVILWGYNQTQPIAKIEGITYAELANKLGFSNTNTGYLSLGVVSASDADAAQGTVISEQAFITALDALRSNPILTGYQITTYSYDPLIGVTSITPPSGVREIYKYDSANRLRSVTDVNGNILKEYQYQYKN